MENLLFTVVGSFMCTRGTQCAKVLLQSWIEEDDVKANSSSIKDALHDLCT